MLICNLPQPSRFPGVIIKTTVEAAYINADFENTIPPPRNHQISPNKDLMTYYRTEHDTTSKVLSTTEAHNQARTYRASDNPQISDWRLPLTVVSPIREVNYARGLANRALGKLIGSEKTPLRCMKIEVMLQEAAEVASGESADPFAVDVFQIGSGTSSNSNMTINVVNSGRAYENIRGSGTTDAQLIHPNDQFI